MKGIWPGEGGKTVIEMEIQDRFRELPDSAGSLLLQGEGFLAANGTSSAVAELANVELELGDGSAESIAVHPQFSRGFALIALVLLEHVHDEALLEFADGLRVENS